MPPRNPAAADSVSDTVSDSRLTTQPLHVLHLSAPVLTLVTKVPLSAEPILRLTKKTNPVLDRRLTLPHSPRLLQQSDFAWYHMHTSHRSVCC